MGGGGGGSSSSSTETNQIDDRIAAEQSIIADDGGTVNVTVEDISTEALSYLVEFGSEVLGLVENSQNTFGEALDFATTAQRESFRLSEESLERAFDNTAGGELDVVRTLVKWGAVAGAAAVGARFAPDIIKALR